MSRLGPVREGHRFDEEALFSWLADKVAGFEPAGASVRQFDAGQSNPTFRVDSGALRLVLRKKPPGRLLPKAHMVEREARVMAALQDSAVPVPRVLGLCEDPELIGTAFFVMELLEGRILWDGRLPEQSPELRAAMWAEMARVLAALHTVDLEATGLSDYGRQGSYFARQIAVWSKQYRRSETEHIEAFEELMEWLPAHIPADDQTTLVHGDFRIDNLVWHPTEPRVVGVLDWELSTLGHPLADVAYTCLPFLMDSPHHPAIGVRPDPATGLPSMEEHLAAYCRLTGREGIPDLPFCLAFSMFRIASILQGVYARGVQGNASSTKALQMGALAKTAAAAAWDIARRA